MCAEYSAKPVDCYAKCKEFFSNFVPLVYFAEFIKSLSQLQLCAGFLSAKHNAF
jgi:hypothetical protein